ncbi:hypothetical protein F4777DRAFT_559801, partial [Nemania sp. FL0916]
MEFFTTVRGTGATKHDLTVIARWPQTSDFLLIRAEAVEHFVISHYFQSQGLDRSEEISVHGETESFLTNADTKVPLLQSRSAGYQEETSAEHFVLRLKKDTDNLVPLPDFVRHHMKPTGEVIALQSLQYLTTCKPRFGSTEYDIHVDVQIINPSLQPSFESPLEIFPGHTAGAIETMENKERQTVRLLDLVGMDRPFSEPYKNQLLGAIEKALHGIQPHELAQTCRSKLVVAQTIVTWPPVSRVYIYGREAEYDVKNTIFEKSELVLKGIKQGKIRTLEKLSCEDILKGKLRLGTR